MYEVDFLPVESESGPGSKSGDAIAIRFTVASENREAIIVIDSGYSSIGDDMVEHIAAYHNEPEYIDLVISTHPDADHLNGLKTVLENFRVGELWVHQPRLHRSDVSDFSNLEAPFDDLLNTARRRGVTITEPFTFEHRLGAQVIALGPTRQYYEELLGQHLAEVKSGEAATAASRSGVFSKVLSTMGSALDNVLALLRFETLTDEGETGPRNNMSIIVLLTVDNRRLLFTGDAGIPALTEAADAYEDLIGSFAQNPLTFIQVPHHGSRRNVGPTILNRILGEPAAPHGNPTAFISSAKASNKHPSAKVVNAFSRRGATVHATEGKTINHNWQAPQRVGWGPMEPIGPLNEALEDD